MPRETQLCAGCISKDLSSEHSRALFMNGTGFDSFTVSFPLLIFFVLTLHCKISPSGHRRTLIVSKSDSVSWGLFALPQWHI